MRSDGLNLRKGLIERATGVADPSSLSDVRERDRTTVLTDLKGVLFSRQYVPGGPIDGGTFDDTFPVTERGLNARAGLYAENPSGDMQRLDAGTFAATVPVSENGLDARSAVYGYNGTALARVGAGSIDGAGMTTTGSQGLNTRAVATLRQRDGLGYRSWELDEINDQLFGADFTPGVKSVNFYRTNTNGNYNAGDTLTGNNFFSESIKFPAGAERLITHYELASLDGTQTTALNMPFTDTGHGGTTVDPPPAQTFFIDSLYLYAWGTAAHSSSKTVVECSFTNLFTTGIHRRWIGALTVDGQDNVASLKVEALNIRVNSGQPAHFRLASAYTNIQFRIVATAKVIGMG